jgi:hypothetical protein
MDDVLGSTFWWAFSLFAAIAIVFHGVMFARLLPCSQRFWKATDYFWLAIAVVGMLGATQKAREAHYRESQRFARGARSATLAWERHSIAMALESDRRIKADLEKSLKAYRHEQTQRQLTDIESVINWRETASRQLAESNPPSGWRKHLERATSEVPTDSKDIASEKQRLRFQLEKLYEFDDSDRFYDRELSVTAGESAWTEWSPFLLAIAIAIRVTKVTAEVLGYDKPS